MNFAEEKGEGFMKMTLAQRRKYTRYTQNETTDIIGVTPETIGNCENGYTSFKVWQFVKLCNLYQISVDDVFLSYD